MSNPLPPESDWLRSDVPTISAPGVTVDRERGIIRGYVVAEKGVFKSKRGEFDDKSLSLIEDLYRQAGADGLRVRYTHPTASSDGLGDHLGRSKDARRDGDAIRADLHFNSTAFKPPPKGGRPYADYLMELAETDPKAFGSSLVLKADKEHRLNSDGTPQRDAAGKPLVPLWRPTQLHASDVVGEGDATTRFLSSHQPDAREAAEFLDRQLGDCDRLTARTRGRTYLDRWIDYRFGPADGPEEDAMSEAEAAANPKPAPAPKPTTPPSNPPANPPAAPKPQPKPALKGSEEEGRGELSDVPADKLGQMLDALLTTKLAAIRAESDASLAAVRAEHETYRQQREADELAAAHRLIDTKVNAAIEDGYLSPGQRDATVEFLRTQDHVKVLKTDGDTKVTQLSMALERLTAEKPQSFGQRIPGQQPEDASLATAAKAAGDRFFTGRRPRTPVNQN